MILWDFEEKKVEVVVCGLGHVKVAASSLTTRGVIWRRGIFWNKREEIRIYLRCHTRSKKIRDFFQTYSNELNWQFDGSFILPHSCRRTRRKRCQKKWKNLTRIRKSPAHICYLRLRGKKRKIFPRFSTQSAKSQVQVEKKETEKSKQREKKGVLHSLSRSTFGVASFGRENKIWHALVLHHLLTHAVFKPVSPRLRRFFFHLHAKEKGFIYVHHQHRLHRRRKDVKTLTSFDFWTTYRHH